MEIKCLDARIAWGLFQTKVGQITLESHPDIPELARLIAGKCLGLPLALNAIGDTMSCKRTVQKWQHAFDVHNNRFCYRVLKISYTVLFILQYLWCQVIPLGPYWVSPLSMHKII